MPPLFETVTDLHGERDRIRRRRYGVIEVRDGRFLQIRMRPFPKFISGLEILIQRRWRRRREQGEGCLVFYDQPSRFPNFLAVKYVVSRVGTTYGSIRTAARVLDEIARIKGTDALLCDAANPRISDRLLRRWGWESHRPQRWRRNYIKRFYGEYPEPFNPWAEEETPVANEATLDAVAPVAD
ncbi:MAG: hypothetical protein IH983_02995 [Planctomycetes bacterium]|nr:hypothetical protein [Planctomycetota bacterium]